MHVTTSSDNIMTKVIYAGLYTSLTDQDSLQGGPHYMVLYGTVDCNSD